MAYHAREWVPGARMCFGSLDFIVTLDGTLERIQTPLLSANLGIATEAERDVRPVVQGDDILPVEWPHGFDSTQLTPAPYLPGPSLG